MIRPRKPVAVADVVDHYDDLDWIYREIWGDHLHHGLWADGNESPERAVRRLVERVAREASVGPGTRVCDVGCGYGATARQLGRQFGASVTGITLSAAQHAVARSLLEADDRITVLHGDWLDNGLPDGGFDAAVAIESTEHMEDKTACFTELRRVLRPGGRLVVCAWLAAEQPRAWQRRCLLEPICREGRLPGMGSSTDYRELLDAAGFRVDRFEDLTSQVSRTWSVCIRRVLLGLLRDVRIRRYVLSPHRGGRNRVFLLTLFRIRAAYACGAMRYGLFAAWRS